MACYIRPSDAAPGDAHIETAALPQGFTLLQVTPRLEGGGVEQATLDIARAVVRAGGRSLVASAGGRLAETLRADGSELFALPVHSRNPLIMATNTARLARLIRTERVSLAHARSRAPAFSTIAAARQVGIPVVATYHGIYQAGSPLKRWYNGVMTRGDLTIANSRFTRDHVMAEHGLAADRIAVAPEGIDTDAFDPLQVTAARIRAVSAAWGLDPGERRPILLLAARLTGWKGQRTMIEAMSRLGRRSDALLVLAGKAERPGEVDALRALAARAGVADRVRLVGPVDDMPAAYAAADLVAAPSTQAESFGRGVAEAGAMERPALASPLGGPAETIVDGETGWLVEPGHPAAWAAAVETALALTPQARLAIGRAARKRIIERHSLAAMTAATFEIYRQVVGGRP